MTGLDDRLGAAARSLQQQPIPEASLAPALRRGRRRRAARGAVVGVATAVVVVAVSVWAGSAGPRTEVAGRTGGGDATDPSTPADTAVAGATGDDVAVAGVGPYRLTWVPAGYRVTSQGYDGVRWGVEARDDAGHVLAVTAEPIDTVRRALATATGEVSVVEVAPMAVDRRARTASFVDGDVDALVWDPGDARGLAVTADGLGLDELVRVLLGTVPADVMGPLERSARIEVTVPYVGGMPAADALSTLRQAGLVPRLRALPGDVHPTSTTAIAVTPGAGASATVADIVVLDVWYPAAVAEDTARWAAVADPTGPPGSIVGWAAVGLGGGPPYPVVFADGSLTGYLVGDAFVPLDRWVAGVRAPEPAPTTPSGTDAGAGQQEVVYQGLSFLVPDTWVVTGEPGCGHARVELGPLAGTADCGGDGPGLALRPIGSQADVDVVDRQCEPSHRNGVAVCEWAPQGGIRWYLLVDARALLVTGAASRSPDVRTSLATPGLVRTSVPGVAEGVARGAKRFAVALAGGDCDAAWRAMDEAAAAALGRATFDATWCADGPVGDGALRDLQVEPLGPSTAPATAVAEADDGRRWRLTLRHQWRVDTLQVEWRVAAVEPVS